MTSQWVNAEWIEEVTLADLPEEYRSIAEVISIRSAILLAEHFGGLRPYVPKLDKLLRQIRNQKIREEFNGANHDFLARKYGLTEIRIRAIVAEEEVARNQPSLFPIGQPPFVTR